MTVRNRGLEPISEGLAAHDPYRNRLLMRHMRTDADAKIDFAQE